MPLEPMHRHIINETVEYQSFDKECGCTFKKVKCACAVEGCDYKRFEYYHYYYPPSEKDKSKTLQKNKKRYYNHR